MDKLKMVYSIEISGLIIFFILLLVTISIYNDTLILISVYGLVISTFWLGYHSRKLVESEKKV